MEGKGLNGPWPPDIGFLPSNGTTVSLFLSICLPTRTAIERPEQEEGPREEVGCPPPITPCLPLSFFSRPHSEPNQRLDPQESERPRGGGGFDEDDPITPDTRGSTNAAAPGERDRRPSVSITRRRTTAHAAPRQRSLGAPIATEGGGQLESPSRLDGAERRMRRWLASLTPTL